MWSLGTHVEAQAGAVFGLDAHKLDTGRLQRACEIQFSLTNSCLQNCHALDCLIITISSCPFHLPTHPHVLQSRSQDCLTVREHSPPWLFRMMVDTACWSSLLSLRQVESPGKAPFQHQFAHQFAVSSVHFQLRVDTQWYLFYFLRKELRWLWYILQKRQGGDGLLRSPETCDDSNTGKGAKGLPDASNLTVMLTPQKACPSSQDPEGQSKRSPKLVM